MGKYGASDDLGEKHILEALLGLHLVLLARHRFVVLIGLIKIGVRRLVILLLQPKL
jgi:hypothetical protein